MEKQVWHNGGWHTLSGSLAEFKDDYFALCNVSYSRADNDYGIFGGYYESSAIYDGQPSGQTGPPTGSRWSS
jgi:hypothetical protein